MPPPPPLNNKPIKEKIKVICRLRPYLSTSDDDKSFPSCDNKQPSSLSCSNLDTGISQISLDGTITYSQGCASGTFVAPSPSVTGTAEERRRRQHIEQKTFRFDGCADEHVSQRELYETHVRDLVRGVSEGYHGTIVAYGQTGSGKTYSMRGPPLEEEEEEEEKEDDHGDDDEENNESSIYDHKGIIPRALHDLFSTADNDHNHDVTISLSYVQLYCEKLQDLLVTDQDANKNNELSHSHCVREKNGVTYVDNIRRLAVTSVKQCLALISEGDQRRTTAATLLNEHSSRSHAIIIITVVKRSSSSSSSSRNDSTTSNTTKKKRKRKAITSNLTMIDLAGSERAKRSGATNQRFTELKAINLSLSAFGNCVAALSSSSSSSSRSSSPHIPYRDSQLTRLLQSSLLGGNSRTILLVCLRPGSDGDRDTLRSLELAQRASSIPVTATINEVVDYETLYEDLKARYDEKEDQWEMMTTEYAQSFIDMV